MLKGKKARALKARDFKKDLKKTTKPPTVKGKPGVKAEELAKSPPRRLPSTATEEDHRKSNITLMPSLKCGLRLSPPKPGFHKRTQEPEKKKPVEMSEREIRRRYSALYRKGGIAEFQQVRVRDGKIECLGPLSWILSTGTSIMPWAKAIATIIKVDHDLLEVSGLPAEIKAQAQDLRCNPHPAKDKNELKNSFALLKGMISQKVCDRAIEIVRENHHLFSIDI